MNSITHRTKSRDGVKKVFDGCKQGYFNSGFSTRRIHSINGYSPTLTTDKRVYFVEIKGSLTAKERFRLQGFDDIDYSKVKNIIPEPQLIKQTGNSITVNVAESVIHNLLTSQNEVKLKNII